MHRILLVEDEPSLREAYSLIIRSQPYELDTAINGAVALEKCATHKYDLILLDLMMPVIDGVGFLQKYHHTANPCKVILLSNLSSGQELSLALGLGAHKALLKADLSPTELLQTIKAELE